MTFEAELKGTEWAEEPVRPFPQQPLQKVQLCSETITCNQTKMFQGAQEGRQGEGEAFMWQM